MLLEHTNKNGTYDQKEEIESSWYKNWKSSKLINKLA